MLVIAILAASVVLTGIFAISLAVRRRRALRARSPSKPVVNPSITMESPLPAIVAARRRMARGSIQMPSTELLGADAPAVPRPSDSGQPRAITLRPSHARR